MGKKFKALILCTALSIVMGINPVTTFAQEGTTTDVNTNQSTEQGVSNTESSTTGTSTTDKESNTEDQGDTSNSNNNSSDTNTNTATDTNTNTATDATTDATTDTTTDKDTTTTTEEEVGTSDDDETPATPEASPVTPTPVVYYCAEGDCCECSSVMSKLFDEITGKNRFSSTTTNYSPTNFADDIREGIHKAIKNGTDYDFELAKLEMMLLLNNYLDEDYLNQHPTIDMCVKEGDSWVQKNSVTWTPKTAVQAFVNIYERKYDNGKGSKSEALLEAANSWNNIIWNYLKFPTEEITNGYGNKVQSISMNTIYKVFENMGLADLKDKTLDEMENELGHVHNTSKAGIHDDCNCSHVCSIKKQTMLNAKDSAGDYIYIYDGADVSGYSHYIEATISTDKADLEGLLSDKIKIGVVNISTASDPFYIVGECVCRLGAKAIEKTNTYVPTWTDVVNGIQPEGVTNITAEFKLDTKMKDVKFEIDLANLINDKMPCMVGGTVENLQIMDYVLADKFVRVKQINGGSETIINESNYTLSVEKSAGSIVDNIIKITFNPGDSGFYAEKGVEYKVEVYIPTKMKECVQYGYLMGEAEGAGYSYINQKKGEAIIVNASLKGKVRTGEERIINGKKHPESYDDVDTSFTKEIEIKYGEMAKIY